MNLRMTVLVPLLAITPGCAAPSEPASTSPAAGAPAVESELSYQDYGRLLLERVEARAMVDYAGLKADRSRLDAFLTSAAGLDPSVYESWRGEDKIAFWINTYNALTLKAIVDHYPIRGSVLRSLVYPENSIRQIPGVWDDLEFRVMGRELTLNEIEHEILRKRFDEPRIHMALVCAARSCPPLRREPYRGKQLDSQLEDQTVRFLSRNENLRLDPANKRVHLSSIFKWFGEDFIGVYGTDERFEGFGRAERAVLGFVVQHLEGSRKEYLLGGDYSIEYVDYDWSLNETP